MKITYLKLVNFSSVYTGMRRKSIEIDLSKSENRVVVLIGKTGSGKTSILAQLHPFAYPPNDSRDRQTMIMQDGEGYKEIHFRDDRGLYIVKHNYKNHNGKTTVKSFITLNGEDLNPNGNVTSFKTVIEEEFSITEDYMKLMRIGPNVQTLLKMPSSSRKEFMGEFMSNIDLFNIYYKNVSEKVRKFRVLIGNVTSRIERLGVTNIDETRDSFNHRISEQTELSELKEKLTLSFGMITGKLHSIDITGKEELEGEITSLTKEISEIESVFDKIQSVLKEMGISSTDLLLKNTKDVGAINIDIMKVTSEINMILHDISTRHEKIQTIKESLIHTEFDSLMESEYERLSEKVAKEKLMYNRVSEIYKSEDLKRLLRLLYEIQRVADRINEFPRDSVRRVINDMRQGINTSNRVHTEVELLERKVEAFQTKKFQEGLSIDGHYIFLPDHECAYKDFYNKLSKKEEKEENDYDLSISSLRILINTMHEEELIPSNFNYIQKLIKMNTDIIDKCPPGIVSYEKIVDSISSNDLVFNEENLTMIIELYTGYEIHLDDISRLNSMEIEVQNGRKAMTMNDVSNSEIVSIETEIDDFQKTLAMKREILGSLETKLTELMMWENEINQYINTDINSKKGELNKATENLILLDERMKQHDRLTNERNELSGRINENDNRLRETTESIVRVKNVLNEYDKLQEENEVLEREFEQLYILRKSLSPSKGAQLILIKVYLQSALSIINRLLDKVYNGTLRIVEFKIDDKDFKIPYINNGLTINDISDCSQGEESYVGMALSFALIFQSDSKFNIPQLDEIDGPLDIDFRGKFIGILEEELNIINAEQCFLITHNDLFEDYPVDVIATSEIASQSMRNKNIIFQG